MDLKTMDFVAVATGGLFGATLRHALSLWASRLWPAAPFAYGTLMANVLGCLLIGLLAGLAETRQLFGPLARLFLIAGLLGGLTTFSSFAWETATLLRSGSMLRAGGQLFSHLLAGYFALWIGLSLSKIGT